MFENIDEFQKQPDGWKQYADGQHVLVLNVEVPCPNNPEGVVLHENIEYFEIYFLVLRVIRIAWKNLIILRSCWGRLLTLHSIKLINSASNKSFAFPSKTAELIVENRLQIVNEIV